MPISTSQRFLVAAARAADAEGYFACSAVAATLRCSPAERDTAVRSLAERKLIVELDAGQARLLHAGREFAVRLEAKLTPILR